METWYCTGLDIAGPFDVAQTSKHYIVMLIDHHSRFPKCLLTNNITLDWITQWLCDLFACYGNPKQLVTDNGLQFVSAAFMDFLKDRDIKHLRMVNYNPRENAVIETFNKTLKHAVQAFSSEKTAWDTGIQELLMQYRATPASLTSLSPAEAFFGCQMHCNFQPVLRSFEKREEDVKQKTCSENISATPKYRPPALLLNPKRNRGPFKKGQ